MVDQHCIGPGVDPSRISPDATVCGASYLTGPRTRVAAGAVVRDSRLHDAQVECGAVVSDSMVMADGPPGSHRCDAAGRTVVAGADTPRVGADALVTGSTLLNTSVAERSCVTDTWARDCRIGADNAVERAKLVLVASLHHVTILGPTEVSEAWLGHHTRLDRRGYLEGIFANAFHRLEFDEAAGRLRIAATLDLPHVSRYGVNTINSTNSGKLLPQPDGVVGGFGPHVGLWHDAMLSHEPILLGPCCWVAPWTKVIGQSAVAHETDESLLGDPLATCLMPFAAAGFRGPATRGLVMPGELSGGFGPKERKGAWVFTYAPDAVIRMVRRLHDALELDRKGVADTIVVDALRTALAMVRAMAARRQVDLSLPPRRQPRGWGRWIGSTHALLRAHLDARLWQFSEGQPFGWHLENGRWTHPRIDRLLALAPDALEQQVSEDDLFEFHDPVRPARVAVPSGAVGGTGADAEIDPEATVARTAHVGAGCRIGPGAVVGREAVLWNAVIEQCTVGQGARIERSIVRGGAVGCRSVVRSCRLDDAALGDDSTADAAAIADATLASQTTVSAFADLARVRCSYPTILGGRVHDAAIETVLMSMHMAGGCDHMEAVPALIEAGGQSATVPAIPMIGGGSVIRGTPERPVRMACSFIGSNAILEPGCFVGFGSFVLGTLGPDAGLLPFTLATGADASGHRIGGVLTAMPSTVITHFVGWTFQAAGPAMGEAVAAMIPRAVEEGIAAVEWEIARRQAGSAAAPDGRLAIYKTLPHYTEGQLHSGLRTYRWAVDSGAWDIVFDGHELRFASTRGRWVETDGSATWKPF